MEIRFIDAKAILSRSKRPEEWFGVHYHMNIYRGCSHGCIYCDSRSECYGIEDFDDLVVKRNAVELLRKELSGKRQVATIGFGAMSDPYHPAEETLGLTREALQVIREFGFPVNLCTKSSLVLRDLALLNDISKAGATVAITLTTVDSALAARVEPQAPSPKERLRAVKALADAGINTGILMMPVLPFLEDTPEGVRLVAEASAAHGAKFIVPSFGVTLRDRQRTHYFAALDRHWPGMSDRYRKAFGNAYSCSSPNGRLLSSVVKQVCRNHGMGYGMREVKTFKSAPRGEQISFFDTP